MEVGQFVRSSTRDEVRRPSFEVVDYSVARGWLRPFGDGQWVYSGPWARLFRQLQTLYVMRLVKNLGFTESIFPRLLPASLLDKLGFTAFKPGILFQVSPLDGQGTTRGFLDPLQNIPIFETYRGHSFAAEELPLRIVETLGGWTWRNENQDEIEGVLRVREFLRVEAIYLGSPSEVVSTRRDVMKEITSLLETLHLPWRVVVGNGCLETEEHIETRRKAQVPDQAPVLDVEVPIGAGWLEISGCSIESKSILADFDITARSGNELASGCCGLGLNRLLHCFFAYYGFDHRKWPALPSSLDVYEPNWHGVGDPDAPILPTQVGVAIS